jgi:hypothetical protein
VGKQIVVEGILKRFSAHLKGFFFFLELTQPIVVAFTHTYLYYFVGLVATCSVTVFKDDVKQLVMKITVAVITGFAPLHLVVSHFLLLKMDVDLNLCWL